MVTEFFFVDMAISPIFLILEEQISVESLVENQKSRLIFILFFQNIIALKSKYVFHDQTLTNLSCLERKLMKGLLRLVKPHPFHWFSKPCYNKLVYVWS